MDERAKALERKIRLWILQQERKRLEQEPSTGIVVKAPGSHAVANEAERRRRTR